MLTRCIACIARTLGKALHVPKHAREAEEYLVCTYPLPHIDTCRVHLPRLTYAPRCFAFSGVLTVLLQSEQWVCLLQVAFSNVVAVGWNTYLSWASHHSATSSTAPL